MAEISDILKIGKDKYLEKNLEQKCGNPFNEWIPYDIISFRCYVENGIKKYEIYGEDIYSRIERIKIRPWRYLISQEDGEFAIKYGIESYFIWRNFWVSNYLEYQGFDCRIHHDSNYDCSNYDDRIKECDNDIKDFWKDFNKELNRRIEKLEEKETEKTEEKENKVTENLKLFNYDDMNKEVVYHNDFSNTIFTDFSLREKKVLLLLIAGINNEDSNDKIYHFDPKEIKNMLSMERKSYGELSKIVHSIQKKPLVILTSKDTMDSISIFDKVTYNAKDQSISVSWGKSAIEMFKNLKGNFSKYFLTNVIKLQSENSVELYLKAESNLFKDNFFISVPDIKKIFSVNYKSIGDMKKRLINCCTDDININTDILLNAIDVKEGRKIVGFTFKVSRKNLLNDTLKKKIEKIKKNIHVSKSGFFSDKKVEKTLHTLFRTFSEKELEKGLELCYKTIRKIKLDISAACVFDLKMPQI